MFEKPYEDRLRAWANFRNYLETSQDPIQDTIDFYNQSPLVNIQVDPYDKETWLDPWSLLQENKYCEFAIILGICYTLQLTTRFSNEVFEIHICTDKQKSEVKYLLYINDSVIGYRRDTAISRSELPNNLEIETIYTLDKLQ